jgi:hypothetical protein
MKNFLASVAFHRSLPSSCLPPRQSSVRPWPLHPQTTQDRLLRLLFYTYKVLDSLQWTSLMKFARFRLLLDSYA